MKATVYNNYDKHYNDSGNAISYVCIGCKKFKVATADDKMYFISLTNRHTACVMCIEKLRKADKG